MRPSFLVRTGPDAWGVGFGRVSGPERGAESLVLAHNSWTVLRQLPSPNGHVLLVVQARERHAGLLHTRVIAIVVQSTSDQHAEYL